MEQLSNSYGQVNVPLVADGGIGSGSGSGSGLGVSATNLANASTSGITENGHLDNNLAVAKYNSRSATDDIMRINSP